MGKFSEFCTRDFDLEGRNEFQITKYASNVFNDRSFAGNPYYAYDILREYLEQNPHEHAPPILCLAARVSWHFEQLHLARSFLSETLQYNPDDHFALQLLGDITFEEDKDYEAALALYCQALESEERQKLIDSIPYRNLNIIRGKIIALMIKAGKSKDALPFIAENLKCNPQDFISWGQRSEALLLLGCTDVALKAAEYGLSVRPESSLLMGLRDRCKRALEQTQTMPQRQPA